MKRLAILLIILSSFGCKTKPDAFICSFVLKNPIQKSYSFCVNYKTKEEMEIPVDKMSKWITTDPDSYETMRDWYKKSCVNNN